MATPVESKVQSINVLDLQVISPLQLDELAFEDIVKILRSPKFPRQEWFPGELDPDKIVASLRRSVEAGLVHCYADSTVGALPIPLPPLPSMKDCWYGLTPLGTELLRHPAPWDYPLRKWTHPLRNNTLIAAVEDLRANPEKWVFVQGTGKQALARGLGGFSSYLSTLRSFGGSAIVVHVFERGESGSYELLQGHFRPWSNGFRIETESSNSSMKHQPLTNVDQIILDVLQDDIECLETILSLLNHEVTPYRKWHFGKQFTADEVKTSLARMINAGYVLVYQEEGDPIVLRPTEEFGSSWAGLWFGLTAKGQQMASEGLAWGSD